jgi:cytochrome c553
MNRAFPKFVKSLLVATLALSGAVFAAEAPAAAPVKADAAKGEALFTNGDAARSIPACASCHGAGGNSTINTNPKLSAQHESYIYKQLVDFTTPNRNNPVMSPIAKALTEEDKRNIAAYVSAQQSKPNAARSKETLDLGKKIYRGGIAERGVAACASCHGANGAGIPVQYPRLAAQQADYTVAQLQGFKAGARKNSIQMTALAKRMSDEEMKAVADYIAGLK